MKLFSSRVFATWTALKKNPVVVNSVTGATLCAASDALAQVMEQRHGAALHLKNQSHQFSTPRLLSACMIGAFFGGWVYPFAYKRLDAWWHGTHFRAVLYKSVVEIVTVGVFVNSVSIASRGLLVGRPPPQVVQHVGDEMPRVFMNDVRVWLPYNLLAFSVIPAVLRPTTTALMEASWQTYISLRSHDYA